MENFAFCEVKVVPELGLDPKVVFVKFCGLCFLIEFCNMISNNLATTFSVAFTVYHRMGCNLNEISFSIAYLSLRYLANTVTVKNETCR